MSAPLPQQSLSTPTITGRPAPVRPAPSSSTLTSSTIQLRRDIEQQIAEKEKQLQDPTNSIGKSVAISRQISQLKDKLNDLERPLKASTAVPAFGQTSSTISEDSTALDKLQALERDLGALSPSTSSQRKDKLSGHRSPGLDLSPSSSSSTMLSPHGYEASSLLPLPPPASGTTPTKRRSKVPNTERRNTDIEFATEIGQGLLMEVRKQQALVREKEDQLAILQAQKADLERAAESLAKQLRQKEETEEQLKEETWNLELARQELKMTITELQQNLGKANAEQARLAQQTVVLKNELDRMRDREEKLLASMEKLKTQHESDMNALRKSFADVQRQKNDYMKQAEKLSSELAIVRSQSRIAKSSSSELRAAAAAAAAVATTASDQAPDKTRETVPPSKEKKSPGGTTPPSSPKLSPARKQALELDQLKTSLSRAHEMVAALQSSLEKEKTEKLELQKLLSESQEAIEQYQNESRLLVGTDRTEATVSSALNQPSMPAAKERIGQSSVSGNAHAAQPAGSPRTTCTPLANAEANTDKQDSDVQPWSLESLSTTDSRRELQTKDNALSPNASSAPTDAANAPRTLSDELGAASSDFAPTLAATIKRVEGVGIATQTDTTPSAEARDGSSQTEPAPKRLLEERHLISSDHAPRESKEQAVQWDKAPVTDAKTQTLQPITVDAEAQTPVPVAVDACVQHQPVAGVDQGVMSSLATLGVEQSVQSDNVETADSAMQSDPVSMLESKDSSTQSDPIPLSAAMGTPTDETLRNEGLASARLDDTKTSNAVHTVEVGTQTLGESEFGKTTSSTSAPTVQHGGQTDNDTTASDYATSNTKRSNEERPKLFTKEEADAMVAAAVAAALTSVKEAEHVARNQKPSSRDVSSPQGQYGDIPQRPAHRPPPHLLSRISQSPTAVHRSASTENDRTHSVSPSDNYASTSSQPVRRTLSDASSLSGPEALDGAEPLSLQVGRQGEADKIALLTQTIVGDWLWKYTRKPLGGRLSEHRHKRFFWIHPYTRTLYWSTQPAGAFGKEPEARSARIHGVSSVPDEGQDPEGLPNVSLLIKTGDRTIKVTAPDMNRHQVWFEALSYLLARTEPEPTSAEEEKKEPDTKTFSETLSSGAESLLKKQSMHKLQGFFRHGPRSEPSGHASRTGHPTDKYTLPHHDDHDHEHDHDGMDDDDEALEDVRMCCDGMHHVSHLERPHIHERPYYRKRKSRQALRATTSASAATPTHVHVSSLSA